jgi:hypothetical protein
VYAQNCSCVSLRRCFSFLNEDHMLKELVMLYSLIKTQIVDFVALFVESKEV